MLNPSLGESSSKVEGSTLAISILLGGQEFGVLASMWFEFRSVEGGNEMRNFSLLRLILRPKRNATSLPHGRSPELSDRTGRHNP